MKMLKNVVMSMLLILCIATGVQTVSAQGNADFNVDANGILVSYSGNGGQITIPKNVKEIGEKAFSGNTLITVVKMSDSVTRIQKGAFDSCYSLKEIKLSEKLTSIEDNAFWGCSSLNKITLPKSLKHIGFGAFGQCEHLKSVYVPRTVKEIENYAFGFMYYGEYVPVIDFVLLGESDSSIQEYADKYQLTFLKPALLKTNITGLKKNADNKLVIRWKKNAHVSGYEIQISTDKKFPASKTKRIYIKQKSKNSYSYKGKKGKTYYVRIRGYKVISKEKYYSEWNR